MLRVEMNEAIRAKLAEYGLEGEFLNGSFDSELVTFKVDIKIAGSLDKRDKQLADSLSWYAKYMADELNVDVNAILDKEYRDGVAKYKLVGYNAKAKTYPLIMEKIDSGQRYKFPASFIKKSFPATVGAK